ncbi:MAG: transcriptional repressor [Pseudomonadaceae bacterium]|nr:transcriptional repressor [Pseudomonadaceae bacterium]
MRGERRQELKAMLQGAGLKGSLVRLKVLEVLHDSERSLRSRELYERLWLAEEQISILTVRQVLGRLCSCGLVQRDERGQYRLQAGGRPTGAAGG